MKKLLFLIFTSAILISCKSTQSKVNDSPITINSATYQNHYGGREGVRGIKIEINATENLKECSYNTIYFSNKKAKIYTTMKDGNIKLAANINTGYKPEDRMLSVDRDKEFKNKAPIKPKYPNLGKDEAIVEYTYKGALKTFKVILKKKKDLFFQ